MTHGSDRAALAYTNSTVAMEKVLTPKLWKGVSMSASQPLDCLAIHQPMDMHGRNDAVHATARRL